MAEQSHNPWAAVAAVAATQWSNVTTADLLQCRCSKDMITTALRNGRVFREHQGVYAVGKPATTPHERAMAAVLSAGRGALLSHLWALWLWDLWRVPTGLVHVTTPGGRSGRNDIVLHRARHLEPDRNYGIPVTTPARTLADCAPLLTPRQLRRAVNQAQIDHRTQHEHLLAQPRLRALVNDHGATRSILEDLLYDLSTTHAFPMPDQNAVIHGVEVDFYYPTLRLVVEADGWSFHWTKIAFENDHERRLHLEANGERVLAVTYTQVTRGRETTARRLAAALNKSGATARGRWRRSK